MYNYIKEYYLIGLYSDDQLDIFVDVKWITEEEKQEVINSRISQ